MTTMPDEGAADREPPPADDARDAEHPWAALVPAYAIGALDIDERETLDGHLDACASCRTELHAYAEVARLLAEAPNAVRAPAALRDRIVAEARAAVRPLDGELAGMAAPAAMMSDNAANASSRRRRAGRSNTMPAGGKRGGSIPGRQAAVIKWSGWLATAASLALAATLGARWTSERDARANAERMVVDARIAIAARDSLLTAVLAPGVQMARLTTTTADAPAARVFWHRTMGIVVLTAGRVAPTKPGRTYQLWGITPGSAPQSLGTFAAGATGEIRAILRVPVDAAMEVTAITEEPEGGSPQPTSTPILAGTLQAE